LTGSTDTLINNTLVRNSHFIHGLGLIIHQTSTVDEWEAKNNLTSSIS
jgi:hypothetical protein